MVFLTLFKLPTTNEGNDEQKFNIIFLGLSGRPHSKLSPRSRRKSSLESHVSLPKKALSEFGLLSP